MNKKNWFKLEKLSLSPKNSPEITFEELPLFNLASMGIATDNFHVANRLGQGGFGPVYKVMFVEVEFDGVVCKFGNDLVFISGDIGRWTSNSS